MALRRSARLDLSGRVPDLTAETKQVKSKVPSKPSNGLKPKKIVNGDQKGDNGGEENGETIPKEVTNDEPSTPKRKRPSKPIQPATPTSVAVELVSVYIPGDINRALPAFKKSRLADPNTTNAPLLSPETSRLLVSGLLEQVSPSKLSKVTTTIDNILEEAVAHLIKIEPRLKTCIEQNPCSMFSPEGLAEEIDPFETLVSGIISQQVSGAAAKSIKAKFIALFNTDRQDASEHTFPTPTQVCSKSIEVLRTAGLSQRKAEYVQGLAEKFVSGEISTSMLFSASYDEVLDALIKVRGLGKWSVEMFASFGLKRMDVFSTGDLGVQRGMASFVGKDVSKLKANGGKWKYMTEADMLEIADKFRPYRTLFMWYMWKWDEVDISTLTK